VGLLLLLLSSNSSFSSSLACFFGVCVFVCFLGVSVSVFWGSFGSGIILLLVVLEFSGFCSYNTRLCFFHCVHNVLVWVLGGFEER
jgi:hypothetical protein